MLTRRTPEEFRQILESIEQQHNKRPPVEKWHPNQDVEVDISIDSDGQWYYQDRPMKRQRLINLFASIVTREGDNYYLVTPVEKALLKVADVPFVIVNWEHYTDDNKQSMIVLHSNTGHKVVLSEEYPLELRQKTIEGQQQQIPYLSLGRGLEARICRSVYYQLIDIGELIESGSVTKTVVYSDGKCFELGSYSDSGN